MKRFFGVIAVLAALALSPAPAKPLVVTPYPLLADCARQIGGEDIEVELLPSRDVHTFSPTAPQLAQFGEADLILLLGKGTESAWIDDLKQNLPASAQLFAVGDALPDLLADGAHAAICTVHDHGTVDPHWWQSVSSWQRAAEWLSDELAHLDPEQAESYLQRSNDLVERLEEVKRSHRRQLAAVPRTQRILAVPHAAFGYLCAEFNLRQVALLGLNSSGELAARHLSECVDLVESSGVPVLFPEAGAADRGIRQLSEMTGVPLAEPLFADGDEQADLSVIDFLDHNLASITAGLARHGE